MDTIIVHNAGDLFARYANTMKTADLSRYDRDATLDGRLLMASEGKIQVCYAPFDHVNHHARIVLVGITPGQQQAGNALREAQRQLKAGADLDTASRAAKGVASFSGPMRDDLITMLDYFEVNALLGIRSCATLFSVDAGLVHYTSALRYPVFVEGDNYSGQPSMTRHPLLRDQLLKHFTAEARALPDALFVPLGAKVAEALEFVARNGALDRERILDGLQHPSPANRERVAYLLGRKLRAELSVKTNADIVDRARNLLQAKIARLRGKC